MKTIKDEEKITSYSVHYSESKFLDKITKIVKSAGVKLIYVAFLAYYAVTDPDFPAKQKAILIGALGYLILPFDLVPDAIPVVGYADDLAALLFAIKTVYDFITPAIKEKALAKVISIFGKIDEKELELF